MEECNFPEIIKEMEKQTEVFEQELKSLTKSEQSPQSDSVKENNQEREAVEEVEKEEKKPSERQKKEAWSEGAVPSQDPTRLKKKYISSEAVENLHQGFHTSGAKWKAGSLSSLSSLRRAGQSCSNTAVSRGRIAFGAYEPSFGQIPLARQDGSSGMRGKPEGGALWGGLFARREPLEFQLHKGNGRQVRSAWQIPNSLPGSISPH